LFKLLVSDYPISAETKPVGVAGFGSVPPVELADGLDERPRQLASTRDGQLQALVPRELRVFAALVESPVTIRGGWPGAG
jgi:hypothetical protein